MPGELVDPSGTMFAFSYIAMHLIDKKQQQAAQNLMALLDFLVPSLEFVKVALSGIVAHFVLLYLFSFCLRKLFKRPNGSNLQIKILAFAYMLYCFFIDQFYNGILNTTSVTVDLSDFLYSDEQILATDKSPCFFEDGIEMDIFRGAPKSTLSYKIFLKQNERKPCFLSSHLAEMQRLEKIFYLTAEPTKDLSSNIIQAIARKDTFGNLNPICESVRTLIFRKNFRRDIMNFFVFVLNLYSSFGIHQKAISGLGYFINRRLPRTGKDRYTSYFSLNDFIQDHSLVAPLSFVQFAYLFKIYFALLALPLVLNMAHYARSRLSDRIQRAAR